ncbi:tRNA threonylcarbamoyl adenosine modification protein YeaZ [Candidatus Termititenax persephonae]|uniref:tRNA threonylcarbamoyl adenosine modification protein YeaZ n=1 Tax=Candidatus Termititenax persephonae TaxID=2218525 RepID=A0A388THN3_9BACT|nr:tRNA threonylcarbamoyl adenosine modification protein YeaZ [Candidatus Termititenax persephonae]
MLTLGLNFATEDLCLAVAGLGGATPTVEKKYRGQTIKAEHLPDYLDELFRASQTSLAEISRLGIAIGPGAFTGLRLSLVTAKTIALALHIPLVPVSTLEALAAQYQPEAAGRNIHVIMDTCRGESAAALFDNGGARLEVDQVIGSADVRRARENLLIENRPADALSVCRLAARAEVVFDRAEILRMTPRYSHASRVNLTAKPELQHLQIAQKIHPNPE